MSKVSRVNEAGKMNSIKQIEVLLADRLVGRLALTKEGLCAFEYAPDWLGSGFSISPFELPLRSGVFIAKRVRLRADSVSSMIACPMDGASLSWIATCSKRESILARLLCWIASHWLGHRDVGPWSFVRIIVS